MQRSSKEQFHYQQTSKTNINFMEKQLLEKTLDT